MNNNSPYSATVRKMDAQVRLDLNTGADEVESITVNGISISDTDSHAFQLVTRGLTPKYRYATLDGHAHLHQDGQDYDCYVYGGDSSTACPIWAPGLISAERGNGGYYFDRYPNYSVEFQAPRTLEFVDVIGDAAWKQYPTRFRVKLFAEDEMHAFDVVNSNPLNNPEQVCRVEFGAAYKCTKMELVITHWSAPHTSARIMYFGSPEDLVIPSEEIESLSVLEEKAAEVDRLSYGITANSCTVKIKNTDKRFLTKPDLFKQGRRLIPQIACANYEKPDESTAFESLGEFYTERFDISSTSQFVKCEAYDVLYGLQDMYLYYRMDQNADGVYVMDGTDTYAPGVVAAINETEQINHVYPTRVNTIGAVFRKIFWLINQKRSEQGIHKAIEYFIDPILDTIYIKRVLLGYDTAWNMLQEAAKFALAYVYTDRNGKVHVVRDYFESDYPDGAPYESDAQSSVRIDTSNSYSCNIPSQCQLVVNEVKASYSEIAIEKGSDDDSIELVIQPTSGTKPVIVEYTFKNSMNSVVVNVDFPVPFEIEIAHDACRIKIENLTKSVTFHINAGSVIKVKSASRMLSDYDSQRKLGLRSFDLKSLLTTVESEAIENAQEILRKYARGYSYLETEWRGDAQLTLGNEFVARTRIAGEAIENQGNSNIRNNLQYELVSNEIMLQNGMRWKTKAIEKKGVQNRTP